ncbi:hypothetical protein OG458_07220 [Streptomyces sp. NBC_01281]|uniref:hypothetical protein n=1 Tax=Streptomyces sp. NBC_01281 TaxID=2903811 RepID=UPI002E0E9B92|nr:hypothetical protein OG458_07220 [Streptomyces sp. NBC_01281]
MAEDQEYDEVDAVVRIPKSEHLADSRKSEGWKRGFTPKTSDKGPEHVEIRLKPEQESGFADKPKIVYVAEYVEDQRPRLTPGQQAVADITGQIHTYNHHRGHTALKGQQPASRVPNLTGQYTSAVTA